MAEALISCNGEENLTLYGGYNYNYRNVNGKRTGDARILDTTNNWSLKGNANLMLTSQLKFTADFDMKSATVTAQGNNELFYLTNTALSYTPKNYASWSFSLKALNILNSNIEGLDTRAYNSSGEQIFYQETVYTRYGPIVEVGVFYAFNKNGNSKKSDSSYGKSEF